MGEVLHLLYLYLSTSCLYFSFSQLQKCRVDLKYYERSWVHLNPVVYISSLLNPREPEVALVCCLWPQRSYFCFQEQRAISGDPWVGIQDSSLHRSFKLSNMPSYWTSAINCTLQLIELIWFIATTLEFNNTMTCKKINSFILGLNHKGPQATFFIYQKYFSCHDL